MALGAFTNIFPSIEDALIMWEKFKGMKILRFEEILKKYPYREVMKGKFGSDNDI